MQTVHAFSFSVEKDWIQAAFFSLLPPFPLLLKYIVFSAQSSPSLLLLQSQRLAQVCFLHCNLSFTAINFFPLWSQDNS